MIDLDAVIDGKEGSPRLTDLLKMAEEHHKKQGQEGADGKIVNLCRTFHEVGEPLNKQ